MSGELQRPALHAEFVRSPEAHARIIEVDAEVARGMPGVVAVFTAADLSVADIPGSSSIVQCVDMDRPVLAREVVRHAGEPIAVVVASSKSAAVDASFAVFVDLDPLAVVASAAQARSDEVVLHPGAGTNVVEEWVLEASEAPPRSEVEVTVELHNGRLVPNSMETLAILAIPDGTRLTVYASHQGPHRLRAHLAPLLGMEESNLRVVVPDVGGAFGMKGMFYPEYAVVAALARELGEPVEWVQTRREHFLTGTHGRAQSHRVTLGGNYEGSIASARVEILADVGAYPHNGSQVPTFSRYVATGLYDIPHVSIASTSVVTNLAPTGSYRGAGRPEAAFAIERAIDAFARACGVDPLEVRRTNFIDSWPYRTATGALYDSGSYREALDRAEEIVDASAVRVEQEARRASGGDPIGLGIGAFVERAGGALNTGEFARAGVREDGTLELRTGSMSSGQGHETVWAQVAGQAFGLDPDRVEVVAGDTALVERGTGTSASRSTMIGASAAWRVSTALGERVRELAADLLEAGAADIVMDDEGPAVIGSPETHIPWPQLMAAAAERNVALVEQEWYVPGAQTFPYGVAIAVVEVGLDLGEVRLLRLVTVDDFGNVMNPMVVEGQVHGSLVQGIGQALYEGVEYGLDGQLRTSSLMDYMLPGAMDVPEMVTERLVSPAPSNPLGAKGAGESGCIGAPPAIVNAVIDALSPWGVTDISMPITPSRVWEALRAAGAR